MHLFNERKSRNINVNQSVVNVLRTKCDRNLFIEISIKDLKDKDLRKKNLIGLKFLLKMQSVFTFRYT